MDTKKIVFLIFLIIILGLVSYPKQMARYPEGNLSVLPSSGGYICKCLGYHTPLVKYYNVDDGKKEPVYQNAKCFGLRYSCTELTQPHGIVEE